MSRPEIGLATPARGGRVTTTWTTCRWSSDDHHLTTTSMSSRLGPSEGFGFRRRRALGGTLRLDTLGGLSHGRSPPRTTTAARGAAVA